MKRVGILTSGGDCQALNATMRGVAKSLYNIYGNNGVEIIGFIDGYKGLMYEEFKKLTPQDFTGLLTVGGTILGSSRQPFKKMREPDPNGLDKVEAMKHTYRRLRLDCLVVLGGNGSQKTANLLSEEGLNVIGLPKTIDNDLWGTDTTFGFQSAVSIATDVIDCIHTTAASHNRIFIVEVMGHKVGWLTLNAGIAGGADIILLPEIPYNINSIISKVKERAAAGHGFTILAVAEGAISDEDAKLPKKEYKKRLEKMLKTYPSISYEIAAKITEATGKEVRVTVPGHMQRGGTPCPYDRVLSSRLGAVAAQMISKEQYGAMVAIVNRKITSVPLSEVAGKLKTVDPKSDIIAEARLLGISFGDD
ncbi:MAG: 6-phosphofructokinase [Oscillospiraceae bacterium]